MFFQTAAEPGGFLLVPTDHSNSLMALFLPVLEDFYGFPDHFLLPAGKQGHFFSMALHRFYRIYRKVSMTEDFRGKSGNFHSIPVAFLQYPEGITGAGKKQFLKLFPVIQSPAEMYILGNISHNRIGTAPQTVIQDSVGHHAEVLGLINDHMAGFPDAVCFFDPFINIGQSRQVIQIKGTFPERYGFPFFLLCLEELPIEIIDRTLPVSSAEMFPVGPE